ncbi:MAG: hypothetical protein ACFFAH_06125 [Promethearchaeota archaeon]
MFFEELSQESHFSGVFGIIAILVALLLGGIVLYKGIETKQKILFYFFITVITTISPWYSAGFGYIYLLITHNSLDYQFYVLLGTIFIPIAINSWLAIYMTIIYPNKKRFVLILYSILSIIFYIYLFYFLFFAPGAPVENFIGVKVTPIDIQYTGFIFIYLAFIIITVIITGLHFSIISIKTQKVEIKWKGRFLLFAFIFFGVGAIADGLLQLSIIYLIIFRLILLASAVFFYIGFIMPKWIKKIFNIQ